MVRCSSAVAERSSAGTNSVMVSIAPPHLEEHRGCWLASIVQGDGGDGCLLTQLSETLDKVRHQVIPMGGTSRKLPGDRN